MNLPQVKPLPQRAIFKQYGVSIGQVARWTGLSYAYVSNILAGNAKPSDATVKRLYELADGLRKGEIHV